MLANNKAEKGTTVQKEQFQSVHYKAACLYSTQMAASTMPACQRHEKCQKNYHVVVMLLRRMCTAIPHMQCHDMYD